MRLPVADQRRLEALQAGLMAQLEAAQDDEREVELDRWQVVADLAQWYLVIATESASASVTVDVDRCQFMLSEAAQRERRPSRRGVRELQQAWLSSYRWPCFPGEDEPPLLRGG